MEVLVYGVWTATHTPTQKSINLKSYHWDFNDDGLITQVGDYFDATGMMMSHLKIKLTKLYKG